MVKKWSDDVKYSKNTIFDGQNAKIEKKYVKICDFNAGTLKLAHYMEKIKTYIH